MLLLLRTSSAETWDMLLLQGRVEIRETEENIKQAAFRVSSLPWLTASDRNRGVPVKSCRSILTPALRSLLPILTFSGPTRHETAPHTLL